MRNRSFYCETLYPTDAEPAFRAFKYCGVDHSITYKYFWSPLAEACIAMTPRSIAFP